MRNKKNIIIISMCIAIFVLSVGYAILQTRLNITSTGNITSTWSVVISNIKQKENSAVGMAYEIKAPSYDGANANFYVGFYKPGDAITYEVTVKNQGTIPAILDSVDVKVEGSASIIYSINNLTEDMKLAKNGDEGDSVTFELKVEFDRNATEIPEDITKDIYITIISMQDQGHELTPSTPDVDQTMLLSSAILRDNNEQSDINIDFSKTSEGCYYDTTSASTVCNNENISNGLYYTSTNTENNRTTYYFRGDIDNNFVVFGKEEKPTCTYEGNTVWYASSLTEAVSEGLTEEQCHVSNVCYIPNGYQGIYYAVGAIANEAICGQVNGQFLDSKATYNQYQDIYWKIVRINEDGSIRLAYNGLSAEATGADVSIGKSSFNDLANDNAYVGYMYGTPGSNNYKDTHANINDSTVKTVLDNWYEEVLKDNYSNYIADAGFCHDRSIATSANLWETGDTALGYGNKGTYYGPYYRSYKVRQPQFACPKTNDLFTTSTSSKGNKALTYPIGMLTTDEAAYSGNIVGTYSNDMFGGENYSNFLQTGKDYWLLGARYADPEIAGVTAFSEFGFLVSADVNIMDWVQVRPVINLKSNVALTSSLSDGTATNPYIIKTN